MAVLDQSANVTRSTTATQTKCFPTLPSESIHFSIYSPPFFSHENGNTALYNYSSSDRDLSNAKGTMKRLDVRLHHRADSSPDVAGRVTAVHCMPVPTGNTGCDAESDFPGDIIRQHVMCRKAIAPLELRQHGACGHGWFVKVAHYHIWKEPLGVRNRLMIKSLIQTIVDDSSAAQTPLRIN